MWWCQKQLLDVHELFKIHTWMRNTKLKLNLVALCLKTKIIQCLRFATKIISEHDSNTYGFIELFK